MTYTEAEYEHMKEVGREFLIERARKRRYTSYTELSAVLARRCNVRSFDFTNPADRQVMSTLLGDIVRIDVGTTNLMLTAIVIYLNENDAGAGFYSYAQDLGLFAKGGDKLAFWMQQVNGVFDLYAQD